MAVQIIVDSAADFTLSQAQALGLVHIPLRVVFGSQEYRDAVDLTHESFYEKLVESDQLPTTCQVSPGEFGAAFQKIVEAGDTAVAVALSGKLSGTYQSALLAAQDFPGKIFVVDSENATVGERILVEYALRLRDQGLAAGEIAAELDRAKGSIRLMALLDTLEYLKKGGRISRTAAVAGSLLSIKPVVSVEHGEVVLAGKARGSRQGNNLLRELVEKCGGIDFSMPFCLVYSGLSDSLLQKYIADSASLWEGHTDHLPISTLGCAIGTHIGPGAVGVAFFAKQ